MIVPIGMRNLAGRVKSSLRNHPPMLTALVAGLKSSIASVAGGTEFARTSLMRTAGNAGLSASGDPGLPSHRELERQLSLEDQLVIKALSLEATSEKPRPSVAGCHRSS